MQKEFEATGDERYKCPPEEAILAIDALGFRRSPGALQTLLKDHGTSPPLPSPVIVTPPPSVRLTD